MTKKPFIPFSNALLRKRIEAAKGYQFRSERETTKGNQELARQSYFKGTLILAWHVGKLRPGESILEAAGRAMGYGEDEFTQKAVQADLQGFQRRYHAALLQLTRSRGHDPERMSDEEGALLAEVLLSEIPPDVRARAGAPYQRL